MALPKSYLTSTKNLAALLEAMKAAQAPDTFNLKFLEGLGFPSSNDRLVVGVLVALGFLSQDRKPTDRYFRFLDQTQSAVVLAEGIREAYKDLFQVNTNAYKLSRSEIINKFKTLSQGQLSEAVLDKMALTFGELVKLADFETKAAVDSIDSPENIAPDVDVQGGETRLIQASHSLGGLHYNIQIILPESRDPKVYDALFRSLREHLL
ncbi:DUF5343 domain-containing protein [Brevundimonas diminuta]|uniref:DUF5343 domain-containing protein n=1 Tax=Brevundimonas diminuta TaxID=293 RepID=UPI002096AF42|nr:DUF5343 domain-containing protein [Brevundimonas diminuta]MCO8031222.1 DUF5343 domain-containing protein [Brevundimonas diminuta]